MAMVRSARSSPPYALIIFVFLWLISTGLAAYFFVQMGARQQDAQTAEQHLNDFATPTEQRTLVHDWITAAGTVRAPGRQPSTPVAEAARQIDELRKRLLPGDKPFDLSRENGPVEQKIAELGKTTKVDLRDTRSLGAAADALANQIVTLTAARDDLKKQLDAQAAAFADAQKTYTSLSGSSKQQLANLQGQLATQTGMITTLNKQLLDAEAKKQQDIKKVMDDAEKNSRELLTHANDQQDLIDRMNKQVAELKREIDLLRHPPAINPGAEADGRIVRATAGFKEVWLSVGSQQHVTTGMTFAVYDPQTGIKLNTDAGKKGDIEVVQVGETTSMARITNLEKDRQIMEGDIINNLVFSGHQRFRFVVYGDFDIDGDGVATPQERDKLVRLIQQWGGIVDDKVTTQTDFLVMGDIPGSASQHFDLDTDQGKELAKQREDQQKNYQALLGLAKDYSVPVLNANRFLSLIGYYAQTVVHYNQGAIVP